MITAEELEKFFELKEKGLISEEEFNQKREEYLSSDIIDNRSSNVHFYTMLFLSILLVALIFTGFYYSKVHSAKSEMENGLGKKGFSVKLECAFNMAGMYTEVPLEGCTRESQVVIFYDNDRKDYSGYGIPSYFDLPQHFQLKVWNGHDKFSLMMVITDRETNKAIAKREISPHSWDSANN